MCGINGYIPNNKSGVFSIENIVETMNNKILHRGRAQDGIFIDKRPHCTIGMVMRRLSVIDFSSGKQPIYVEDKSKIIVFNGEIYNF